MLSKTRRLRAAEVRAILVSGRSSRGTNVSCKYVPAVSTRTAVVVSKKVAKTAVMRNKLRRAAYRALDKAPLPPVHAVFFLHTTIFEPEALTQLCSKLS